MAITVQGCGTLSVDECQSPDWYAIGHQDGLQGRTPRPVSDYFRACARQDAAIQIATYKQGRDDGLRRFCRPRNGFSLGLQGARYNSACPVDAEPDFLAAYEQGKEIFEAELQIRRLEEILQVNTSELENLTATLKQKKSEVVAYDTLPERRISLLEEMHDLQQTLALVVTEIRGIEAALEQEDRHLQALRNKTVVGVNRR